MRRITSVTDVANKKEMANMHKIFKRAYSMLFKNSTSWCYWCCIAISHAANDLKCSASPALKLFEYYFKPSRHSVVYWGIMNASELSRTQQEEARKLAILLCCEMTKPVK